MSEMQTSPRLCGGSFRATPSGLRQGDRPRAKLRVKISLFGARLVARPAEVPRAGLPPPWPAQGTVTVRVQQAVATKVGPDILYAMHRAGLFFCDSTVDADDPGWETWTFRGARREGP